MVLYRGVWLCMECMVMCIDVWWCIGVYGDVEGCMVVYGGV